MTPAEAKIVWRACAKDASERLAPKLAKYSHKGKPLVVSKFHLDSISTTQHFDDSGPLRTDVLA